MPIEQKVGTIICVDYKKRICIRNTYSNSNPDFPGLCLQDAPLGMIFADNATGGIAGVNAASSFDKDAILARCQYMG